MDVTLSSNHFQVLWPATKPPALPTSSRPIKSSAISRLGAPLQNAWGTNPFPVKAKKAGGVSRCRGLIQHPCGQNPVPLVSAFQHRVATTTVSGGPVLTTGSNRSLRSLGRAKAQCHQLKPPALSVARNPVAWTFGCSSAFTGFAPQFIACATQTPA